ncbi:hypothetical protein ACFV1L_23135 [Kitasatospora sp. NPDC059646]|uniref:hypothetical protein n=1 Tax=Kitasatospora sp. NPDC059646 TaxID=3346893 RepID=UPI003694430B
MPFADSPQREYAAATEWAAGRALDALTGAEGAALPAADVPEPQALLAADRVLGPDVFAPALLTGRPTPPEVAARAAEAFVLFPADWSGVHAWRDRATAELLGRAGHPVAVDAPPLPPDPGEHGWQRWSVLMAQLCCLALPTLDSPVHQRAREHPLALARGATRAMLRRDHRTATRLARWLAWLQSTGTPLALELRPLLRQLALTGDGTARTALDLAVAERLAAA